MTKQDAINKLLDCIKNGTIAGEPITTSAVEAIYLAVGIITQINEMTIFDNAHELVWYLCDRKDCGGKCNTQCKYTKKIEHAKNFKLECDYFIEIDSGEMLEAINDENKTHM